MLSVFALLMSAVTLLCNKIYFTYMGSFMAPFCVTCLMLRSCNLHHVIYP